MMSIVVMAVLKDAFVQMDRFWQMEIALKFLIVKVQYIVQTKFSYMSDMFCC